MGGLSPSPPDAPRRERRAVVAAAAVFAALSLTFAATSEGFVAADACLHYLYAKFAIARPTYLVDVWGRPVCTALYALPAAVGGRFGVRVTSLLLALACAAATYRVARAQRVARPSLAFVFVLAQPLLFLHSFGEMTELPFAALLAFAFWAYQSRRWIAAAALVSLLPLARPEGFGFIALAFLAFVLHRRWLPLLLLPVPLVMWNHAGWELHGREGAWWRWLVDHWPYASESLYPSGYLLHFVAMLPVVVSPLVLPATLVGMWRSVRDESSGTIRDHLYLCRMLTALLPLSVLAGHSALFWLGKMASFGEPRYLLVAAPFWGLLSARGWEWAFDRLDWRHPARWAGAAALAPLLALPFVPVLPLRVPDHWHVARAAADGYRDDWRGRGYPRVLASHPAVFYYLGIDPKDERHCAGWGRVAIDQPPAGTLLVWDPIYATRNANSELAVSLERIESAGWVPVPELDVVLEEVRRGREDRFTPDRAEDLGATGRWRAFRSPSTTEQGVRPDR